MPGPKTSVKMTSQSMLRARKNEAKTGHERAKTGHEQVTGPGPTRAKKKEPTCPFDSESVLKYLVDNGCPNVEKSKVRSIREKQRLSGASEAETSVSMQKPGKTA